jgi:LmbE family N-acetylglucosaminyl deacetylase
MSSWSVILSPHLDDAVLSCWSVLTNPDAQVINVFAGLPSERALLSWWDRVSGASSPRQRALERAQEDQEALAVLGLEPLNLGFVDDDHRDGAQDVEPLVAAIAPLLEPDATVYAPAGIGAHQDHRAVRAAGLELHRRGFAVTLYAELPYCNTFGWPHWVTGEEPSPFLDVAYDWESCLEGEGLSIGPERALVRRLDDAEREAKLSALRCYRTQFSGLERGAVRFLSSGDTLAFEVFWPLEPTRMGTLEAIRSQVRWRVGLRHGGAAERVLRHPVARSAARRVRRRLGRYRPARPPRANR